MRAARTAWTEALTNVLATPMRFGLVALAVAASVLFVGWREASLLRQLDEQARDRIQAGEFISVAMALTDDEKATDISGTSCDRLTSLPGIVAAGVVRESGRSIVDAHPNGGYQLVEVSPGFLHVAGYQKGPGQILVGASAASELGLRDGSVVSVARMPLTAMVIDVLGARTALLDRSLVRVRTAGELSGTCYVEFASTDHAQASQLLPSLLGQRLHVSPLVETAGLGPSPAKQYDDRFDGLLWVALAFVPLIPGVLVTRSRRNELALYSILGAGRALTVLMLFFEWLILAVPAVALTMPTLAVACDGDGEIASYGLRAAAAELLAILAASALYTVLTTMWRPSVYELLRRAE